MVGREVGSCGVRRHYHIDLVQRSGVDAVICFFNPSQTKGTDYSVVGGGVLCWWRHTLLVAEVEAKMELITNSEEV